MRNDQISYQLTSLIAYELSHWALSEIEKLDILRAFPILLFALFLGNKEIWPRTIIRTVQAIPH